MSERCVIHFCVPLPAGGVLSAPLGGDVSKLPPALAASLSAPGRRFGFACDARLEPGPQHVMSGLAGEVNCVRCRKTPAWLAAPDEGPRPKYPDRPAADPLAEFLPPEKAANGG